MRQEAFDTYGRPSCKVYNFGKILLDSNFEKRLKLFDPNLKLVFDQARQRWTILEWALDNSGWNILIRAEDDQGNEKPLGEWVFNKLFVWRHNQEEKARKGVDQWIKDTDYECDRQKEAILRNHSNNFRAHIVEDINEFRRGFKIMNNESPADVTAGYPKVAHKRRIQNGTTILQRDLRAV